MKDIRDFFENEIPKSKLRSIFGGIVRATAWTDSSGDGGLDAWEDDNNDGKISCNELIYYDDGTTGCGSCG